MEIIWKSQTTGDGGTESNGSWSDGYRRSFSRQPGRRIFKTKAALF
jgi:hypothetical protein